MPGSCGVLICEYSEGFVHKSLGDQSIQQHTAMAMEHHINPD